MCHCCQNWLTEQLNWIVKKTIIPLAPISCLFPSTDLWGPHVRFLFNLHRSPLPSSSARSTSSACLLAAPLCAPARYRWPACGRCRARAPPFHFPCSRAATSWTTESWLASHAVAPLAPGIGGIHAHQRRTRRAASPPVRGATSSRRPSWIRPRPLRHGHTMMERRRAGTQDRHRSGEQVGTSGTGRWWEMGWRLKKNMACGPRTLVVGQKTRDRRHGYCCLFIVQRNCFVVNFDSNGR